jgi:hypothetical protein
MRSIRQIVGVACQRGIARRAPVYALLVAAVVGCVFAANAPAAHRLTAAVYRAHARTICTMAERAVAALPPPKHGETAVMVKDWSAAVKIEEIEIAALKRLTPPATLAPLVRRGLAAKAAQVAVFKHALAAVRTGTPPLQAAFLLAKAPDDSLIWAKVGVAVCRY